MAAKTKSPKCQYAEVEGEIFFVRMDRQKPFGGGSRYFQGESYEQVVTVRIRDAEGRKFWFRARSDFRVAAGGPYYIAITEESDWVASSKWSCEGSLGAKGLGDTPVLRVKVGDRVRIKGRVKGNPDVQGTQLTHVQRLDWSYEAARQRWNVRYQAAKAKLFASAPNGGHVGLTREESEGWMEPMRLRLVHENVSPTHEELSLLDVPKPADIPGCEWKGIGWFGHVYSWTLEPSPSPKVVVAVAEGVKLDELVTEINVH
jgi:hypothetical protein